MIEKIEAHRTSDGKVFIREAEALEHENTIGMDKALCKLIESSDLYVSKAAMIHDFIMEHRQELFYILRGDF